MYLLLLLILPAVTLAQSVSQPDTIIAFNGKAFPCLVKEIDDSYAYFVYNGKVKEKILLDGVRKLIVDSLGTVYDNDKGFEVEEKKVTNFIERRNKRIAITEEKRKKKLLAIEKLNSLDSLANTGEVEVMETPAVAPADNMNRWSFGFEYIPYYWGDTFTYLPDVIQDYALAPYYNNKVMMESSFSYKVFNKIRILFNIGYNQKSYEERKENYSRNNGNSYNSGYERTEKLNILFLSAGVKYSLKELSPNNVGPYLLFNLGKRFAFPTSSYKNLIDYTQQGITENNAEDYLKEINSPYYVTFGFGAEYAFNNSLTLFSAINISYYHTSGKFEYRNVNPNYEDSLTKDMKISSFETRIGVGLNFYF